MYQEIAWDSGDDGGYAMSTRVSNSKLQACEGAFSRADPSPELQLQGTEPASVETKDDSETASGAPGALTEERDPAHWGQHCIQPVSSQTR